MTVLLLVALLLWALAVLGIVLFLGGAARLRDDEVARRQTWKERRDAR